jgi:hypothetical protein
MVGIARTVLVLVRATWMLPTNEWNQRQSRLLTRTTNFAHEHAPPDPPWFLQHPGTAAEMAMYQYLQQMSMMSMLSNLQNQAAMAGGEGGAPGQPSAQAGVLAAMSQSMFPFGQVSESSPQGTITRLPGAFMRACA